jgi:hypothetical protein
MLNGHVVLHLWRDDVDDKFFSLHFETEGGEAVAVKKLRAAANKHLHEQFEFRSLRSYDIPDGHDVTSDNPGVLRAEYPLMGPPELPPPPPTDDDADGVLAPPENMQAPGAAGIRKAKAESPKRAAINGAMKRLADNPPKVEIQNMPKTSGQHISVVSCIRCGGGHDDLALYALNNAPATISGWATCPETGQPMFVRTEVI